MLEPILVQKLPHLSFGPQFDVPIIMERIRVAVPPATPQQLCYARIPHGYVFADDVRLFPHLMPVDVDVRAVYALLRYGAIPAPLTLYAQVRRIPPSRRTTTCSATPATCRAQSRKGPR